MKPLAQCRLYAFIDAAYLRGRAPADIALLTLRRWRGLDSASRQEIHLRAEILKNGWRDSPRPSPGRGVGLVINDHADIAREVGADLCHLGQEDFGDGLAFWQPPSV